MTSVTMSCNDGYRGARERAMTRNMHTHLDALDFLLAGREPAAGGCHARLLRCMWIEG